VVGDELRWLYPLLAEGSGQWLWGEGRLEEMKRPAG
jgi:hypothetical protein